MMFDNLKISAIPVHTKPEITINEISDAYFIKRSGISNFLNAYRQVIEENYEERLENALEYFSLVDEQNIQVNTIHYEGVVIYRHYSRLYHSTPNDLYEVLCLGKPNLTLQEYDKAVSSYNIPKRSFPINACADYYLRAIGSKQ